MLVLGWYEYREVLHTDLELSGLHARVLDDHASRAMDGASLTLTALSQQVHDTDVFGGSVRAQALLAQPLAAMPYVRSLHLLDETGLVLASSDATDVGTAIELTRLGDLPSVGQEKVGRFIPGRGLSAMAKGAPAAETGSVGFFPLSRALKVHGEQMAYVVALLNPDSFSSFQLAALDNPHAAAYLMGYDGELLASSSLQAPPYGSRLGNHLIFKEFLPKIEFSSFVGLGVSPSEQVGAFRLVKNRPLVVLVEKPLSDSRRKWFLAMRWFALVGALTVLFIIAMSIAAHRNLKRRLRAFAELRAARAEVVRREQELRVLLKSVEELIFRTDVQGNIIYANDSWVCLRGTSVSEAVGVSVVSLVEPEQRDAVSHLFVADADNAVRTVTARMPAADGKVRQFDFAVVPLLEGHTVIGFVGSAVDVTERVDAEAALQRQLAFVALVLEVSPSPVATFDGQGRYATVNRAWEDFMGLTRAEVVGKRGVHVMTADDAAVHAQRDAELTCRGDKVRYEAKVTHRDGTRRDVIVTKVMLPGSATDEFGWLSTMMDVSEFREAERVTREAKEAAEESSRAKSEFTANVSHELRTPLQAILGFSELGVLRAADQPRLQSMFQQINGGGQRMLALVNNLLDISRIESAVGSMHLVRADVRGLVSAAVHDLKGAFEAKALQVTLSLGLDPLVAKVDAERMQHVMRNLLSNAIKYSPAGSEVVVTAHEEDGREVWLQVRDHGPGIPPEELESIFEAFEQSSRTKDGSGGTGLGLAVCRKIVDFHGGRVEAANMPDGGAIFTVSLPLRHH
jgi:PAS domain S-box-containing protein